MAAVTSYLLLWLPAVRVAVGGAAVAVAGVAAGTASERWLWPGDDVPPRQRWRRAAEGRCAGRLPRPRPGTGDDRWALAAADGCDIARCEAFFSTLDRWPRDVWLAIGRAADESPRGRHAAAERSLAALVSARELRFTAWLVRDRVETVAEMAGSGAAARRAPRTSLGPAEHRALAAAREVVERAALAHLLRPRLAADVYAALTEPVAVVPMPNPPNPYAQT